MCPFEKREHFDLRCSESAHLSARITFAHQMLTLFGRGGVMGSRGIMSRRVVQPVTYREYAGHRRTGAARRPPTAPTSDRPRATPGPSSPRGGRRTAHRNTSGGIAHPTKRDTILLDTPADVPWEAGHHKDPPTRGIAGHSSCRYPTAQRSRPSRPVAARPARCPANHRIPHSDPGGDRGTTVGLTTPRTTASPQPRDGNHGTTVGLPSAVTGPAADTGSSSSLPQRSSVARTVPRGIT